jgi:integrase
MICVKCKADVPTMPFCGACGWKQKKAPPVKHKRGNGQGSVIKLSDGRYKATVTLDYYFAEDGRKHRHTRSKIFELKKDAIAAIPGLKASPRQRERKAMTFWQVFDAWLPTHKAGKTTLDCYRAAIRYFGSLYAMPFPDVDVDDLQDCIDECPKGKRTKENMRAAVGLMYKYAIPRHLSADGLNLAQYLTISGDAAAHRDALTADELARLWACVDSIPGVRHVLIMCYTGFRPSEYLALTADSYDAAAQTLTGGSKTDAGRDRIVTLSPRIQPLVAVEAAHGGRLTEGGPADLKRWSEQAFYPALAAAGIDNPLVEISGGVQRHRITPHSCRHTFATLIKRVAGADKDKLELIGHASTEMLRHYQDVSLADLRAITDAL